MFTDKLSRVTARTITDAENVRIRSRCDGYDNYYVYNTNATLSQLLMKTTNGKVIKYVDAKTAAKSALSLKNPSGGLAWGNVFGYAMVAVDTGVGIYDNVQEGTRTQKIVSDAVIDVGSGVGTIALSAAAGAAVGSVVPVAGNVVGALAGAGVGMLIYLLTDVVHINERSVDEWIKEGAGHIADQVVEVFK